MDFLTNIDQKRVYHNCLSLLFFEIWNSQHAGHRVRINASSVDAFGVMVGYFRNSFSNLVGDELINMGTGFHEALRILFLLIMNQFLTINW
jgi:hypothetical protein